MADDIPQWAMDRACALGREDWGVPFQPEAAAVQTLARYIAEHEEPPVDPLLIEAREILARHSCFPDVWRSGDGDAGWSLNPVLDALKRGMELAQERLS